MAAIQALQDIAQAWELTGQLPWQGLPARTADGFNRAMEHTPWISDAGRRAVALEYFAAAVMASAPGTADELESLIESWLYRRADTWQITLTGEWLSLVESPEGINRTWFAPFPDTEEKVIQRVSEYSPAYGIPILYWYFTKWAESDPRTYGWGYRAYQEWTAGMPDPQAPASQLAVTRKSRPPYQWRPADPEVYSGPNPGDLYAIPPGEGDARFTARVRGQLRRAYDRRVELTDTPLPDPSDVADSFDGGLPDIFGLLTIEG